MNLKHALSALALATSALVASAQIVTINSRADFNATGTIAFNSNFDDLGSVFSYPDNPFTRGGVTYTSATNLTVGSDTWYSIGKVKTVMSNDWWSPITGTIDTNTPYNLFGFDAAVTSGPVDITVSTNLGTYHFNGLTLADGSQGLTFEGFFATGSGEYFTSFRIDTIGGGYLPGMTNVALGISTPAAVPEPSAYGLFGAAALVGLGLVRRCRRQRAA